MKKYTTFRTIVQEEGIKGLFKGLAPHLIGVTPSRSVTQPDCFISLCQIFNFIEDGLKFS